MRNNGVAIEERIQNMKKFYLSLDKIIDEIPDSIPENIRNLIKDKILGDKELKELMEGIDSHRPPRILFVGRTGSGKSSLINALCSSYVAQVSDTESCTKETTTYQCKDNGRVLMDIMDTRGIAESESLDEKQTAEEQLLEQVNEFSPDVAVLLLSGISRDNIDDDINFLKALRKEYYARNLIELPIVVVINKVDMVNPARQSNPMEYSPKKLQTIKEMKEYYQRIIVNNELKVSSVVEVSSLMEWMNEEGEELSPKDINYMPPNEINNLKISFDGRYHIEELRKNLEEAIENFEAVMGLRMALRLDELVRKIAKQLINLFSSISGVVAATPIPISDIYILIVVQSILVVLIAALSGREISLETAKEFLFSLGGVAGAGFGFRLVAQQASKLLNLIVPVSGSVISTTIAAGGTYAMGKAAIAYYIENKELQEVKETIKETKEKFSKSNN